MCTLAYSRLTAQELGISLKPSLRPIVLFTWHDADRQEASYDHRLAQTY